MILTSRASGGRTDFIKGAFMSAEMIFGFFFYWIGIGIAALAFRAAVATPTRGEGLIWFSTGVFGGGVLLYIATDPCNYSPPGSSTLAAYAVLVCVVGLGVEVSRKPIEEKATEDSPRG